ncbi:MAG: flavin reductase [Clostridiales bacterium]|nr:flavin reductase [Clostridiales bacterium]
MKKQSVSATNDYCPQTLFLYGTYKEDGSPNFGLFCWMSYANLDDHLGVMACIGEKKLTKDRIFENEVFSANLVTESMLPVADYLGCTKGYSSDKMNIDLAIEQGEKLNVPILSDSPVSFELKVVQRIPYGDSDVFLCDIVNTLIPEEAVDAKTDEEKYELIKTYAPICTTNQTYYSFDGRMLGKWGDFVKNVHKKEL